MIYVIGGMKYSVCKSAAAVNLSIYLSKKCNGSVLLADADPSHKSSEFINSYRQADKSSSVEALKLAGNYNFQNMIKLSQKFDHIVIDSGLGESLENALKIADKLLVPFSRKDHGLWTVWTLAKLESVLNKVWDDNYNLNAYSFLMGYSNSKRPSADVLKALLNSQCIDYIEGNSASGELLSEVLNHGFSTTDLKHPQNIEVKEMSAIFDNL